MHTDINLHMLQFRTGAWGLRRDFLPRPGAEERVKEGALILQTPRMGLGLSLGETKVFPGPR